MKTLLIGARGAVGTVVRAELERLGHQVTRAGRSADSEAVVDLGGDLPSVATHAREVDVVVNASGIERVDLAHATGTTPLVDISATSSYLDALLASAADRPVVLGVGLAPGLTTVVTAALPSNADDDIDVLVMLGSGEQHGPAAVEWTAGLVGSHVHRPPEGGSVRNLTTSVRAAAPDGRTRRYLRADFPDHILLARDDGRRIRSYLTLSSAPMTTALALVGRFPALRATLKRSPHIGSDEWHVVARNRRTGEQRRVSGRGQSEATGRLTALAAIRAAESDVTRPVTMADLVSPDDIEGLGWSLS
ncbi:saccharopine dehydrogenase [Gordonia sp. (in: high G+C Gram-positive bacteria)]|uniref:saccharopine dehydrogenase n=1 Tax=Gordonia sp. (in: high G+C Gram-positive bacteria) TaxID=84139 RepID=UPI003F9D43FE